MNRTSTRNLKHTVAPTIVAVGLVAASCTGGSGPTAGPDGSAAPDSRVPGATDDGTGSGTARPIGFAPAALRQFDGCSAFLDYVHSEGAERVGPYGFGDNGWFGPEVRLAAEESVGFDMEDGFDMEAPAEEPADEAASFDLDTTAAAPNAGSDDSGGSDGTFSTTNVQVQGVDEPDIVKTDGTRIVAIAGDVLHYVDIADDGTTGTKRGSIRLSGEGTGADFGDAPPATYTYGHEIFLAGDRAVVIAEGEGGYWGGPVPMPEQMTVDGDVSMPFPGPGFSGPTTVVIEIDLSDPDELRVANTMQIDGRYVSARSVGDVGRIVVTSPPRELGFVYPTNPNATETAEAANRELITNSTLEDWMPTYTLTAADGSSSTGDLVSCEHLHAPSEFSGFDMLSIVTLDLGASLTAPTGGAAVMATGDTVYASADRMYVSTNVWLPPTIDEQQRGEWEENYETAIHRFSIAGDGPAAYEASGSVEGHLLNQFSMNDRDGTFFVATTTGSPWGVTDTDNRIIAMEVVGDELVEVGRVTDLGLEGETIFSVRYVDDVAYLVTFRQTDPFYVVDLSDPTNMTVLGELKIPGYSSYLHPISDTLVLGVGQDASEEGFTTGTKVSLFDVSDPGNPREVDVWTLPNAGSDVEFDHRAFLYWAPTGTAVLPLTSWAEQYSGAVVLNVSADGLVEQGRVTHADDAVEPGQTDCDVVSFDGLTEQDGDLFWISQDPGTQLQTCGPNDVGGATGHYCDVIPVDEIDNWFYFGDGQRSFGDLVDLDDVDRFEWCWVDGLDWEQQIRRTLVIDGQLWTLSNERLQANDLATLSTTATIEL